MDTLPSQAPLVAGECGNLPLALAMVGAMVRGMPTRWAKALDKLRRADLHKVKQQFPHYSYPDLLGAIHVSVAALDPEVYKHYLDFALFPEDALIPEGVLQTLWQSEGLSEYDVQDVIDVIVARSLARRDENGHIIVHDLLLDYVRNQHEDVSAVHNRLLNAYAAHCPHGWPSGPDDGYFFENLAYHLHAAGREMELRNLLLSFNWLRAKLAAVNIHALIADYELLHDDESLARIREALHLSAHVLATAPTQLAGQLLARLLSHPDPSIERLLTQTIQWQEAPWLRPLNRSLTPPGGPLRRTLKGHTGDVWSVAATPDSRHAVSASHDSTLKVWDLVTGRGIRTLEGHQGPVFSVAVTPDGRHAVSASRDQTLRLWNLERAEIVRTFRGHDKAVYAVTVTPDGRYVVSASADCSLKVWNMKAYTHLATFTGESELRACAIAPDGVTVVAGSKEGQVHVLRLEGI